jgi:hypothetical protein
MTPGARSRLVLGAGLALGSSWYLVGKHLPGQLDIASGFALLLLTLAVLERVQVVQVPEPDRLLLGLPSILLVGAVLWRDSEILSVVNVIALAGLVALRGPGGVPHATVLECGVGDLAGRMIRAGAGAAGGALPALGSLDVRGRGWVPQWSLGLGVVAVSPALVVFALLLNSADPLLGQLLSRAFSAEFEAVLGRLLPILFSVWVAIGVLWVLSRRSAVTLPRFMPRPAPGCLPAPMVISGLTALAALFALFLILQARFLVGGRALVLDSAALTFADYARRGFFELVLVSTLMLPILLGAEWAADQRLPAQRRGVRLVLRLLLVLLGGLVASAVMRMVVYSLELGLTELRLYTTAFMGWLAFVLVWFGATVLRGRRTWLVPGALGSALVVLLALNLLNPTAWIVRTNIARAVSGRPLDVRHLADLGGGAVPAALDVLDRLEHNERCALTEALHERWVVQRQARRHWTLEGHRAGARAPELRAARQACREGVGADRDS